MMRLTFASSMPTPSKSSLAWRRWNTPNSLSAYCMSKPTPLSRTQYSASVAVTLPADFDSGSLGASRVLERVADQVAEDELDHRGIARRVRQLAYRELDRAVFAIRRELAPHPGDDVIALELRDLHRRPSHPRKCEQVVGQRARSLGGITERLHVVLRVGVELARDSLAQQVGEAADMPDRCPQ